MQAVFNQEIILRETDDDDVVLDVNIEGNEDSAPVARPEEKQAPTLIEEFDFSSDFDLDSFSLEEDAEEEPAAEDEDEDMPMNDDDEDVDINLDDLGVFGDEEDAYASLDDLGDLDSIDDHLDSDLDFDPFGAGALLGDDDTL